MGGNPQLLPVPTVQYDMDWFWPGPNVVHNIADPFDTNAAMRYTGAQANLWTMNGGGISNMNVDPRGGFCGQIASLPLGQVRDATGTGFNFRPVLLAGGPSLTYEYPVHLRVWRLQVVFQLQNVVAAQSLGRETFIGLIPNGGAGPDAAGASYFGIVLSTTGRWQYVSRAGGIGFGYSEVVDLFPNVTTPHTLDLEILAALGGAAAQLRVYLDGSYGAPFLSRSWAGGLLPLVTASVVNATAWQARLQAHDAGFVTTLQILAVRACAGQFTAAGQQVF